MLNKRQTKGRKWVDKEAGKNIQNNKLNVNKSKYKL